MGVLDYTTAKTNELLKKCDNMPEGGSSGKTPVLETGETTTLAAGDNATSTVVRAGEDASGNPKYKLNFGIPKGKDGTGGSGGGVADPVDWDHVQNKPSWVNRGSKPEYTATEVGALPSTTTIPSKTSELDNDSDFVKTTNLKTINGNSIVGVGNIEITGSGGGIADAPLDGKSYVRKSGAWSLSDIVDVSDIINNVGSDDTLPTDDINRLKEYIINGRFPCTNTGDGFAMFTPVLTEAYIILTVFAPYGGTMRRMDWMVDLLTRKVTTNMYNYPSTEDMSQSVSLVNYAKKTSYSAITVDDTINDAIGKLEAGLGGGGSNNTYILPSAILDLTDESSSAEILTAFGGESALEDIFTALQSKKCFYLIDLKNSIKPISIPVSITFQKISTLISVGIGCTVPGIGLKSSIYYEMELQGSMLKPSFSSRKIYPKGYPLNMGLYSLMASSTSAEISAALGGESGLKEIIKAANDGNRFIITGMMDLAKCRTEISIIYGLEENGSMTVMFSGVGYGLFGGALGGLLVITFDKASETFTATAVNIKTE
ncbi:hypothetical protein [Bacteroides sp.]|uniref:hypothetical protein n=1 Tax=Bacteroides sp. TaxID=29523 RepID=UPI002603C30F|nr:hypothetical protein [Bacteroides sp.]